MHKKHPFISSVLLASALLLLGGIHPVLAEGGAAMDFAAACAKEINNTSQNAGTRSALNKQYNAMRSSCSEYRNCKRSCRKEKQACKGDAKADKNQCISACKKISNNKERKACKQACRSDKKAVKADCKQSKRSCKEQCRSSLLTASCKSARKSFWGEVAKTTEKTLRSCMKEYPKQ